MQKTAGSFKENYIPGVNASSKIGLGIVRVAISRTEIRIDSDVPKVEIIVFLLNAGKIPTIPE